MTTTRARTLVLNWQLRSTQLTENLNEKLVKALQKTRFSKDGSLLTFGVESPLLREEIEARLKRNGIFADASFQRDIVRMPVEAFVEFLDELLPAAVKEEVRARLVKDKQLPDKSFKALAKGVLGKLGEKVMGEIGKELAGDLVKGAGEVAGPAAERVSEFISGLLQGKAKQAVDFVQPGEFIA
ncbi:hypothetical protein [Rhizobium leguminosarum]|uniref:hypothetical protein n=1 Tax=Rhizobium leguminosarum TaxID=384 RepID=UPI0013AFCEE2|nr:hypothetical protein [Rhizobium leguminosarum]